MVRPKQIRDLSKSLELDLAISRVRMAAMKAKAGLDIDDDEVRSAALLLAYLKRLHAVIAPPNPPSADLVPQDNIRNVLLENLATFTPQPPELELDLVTIPEAIDSLGHIEAKDLTAERANTLISLLKKMSYQPKSPDFVPDPPVLSKLDDA